MPASWISSGTPSITAVSVGLTVQETEGPFGVGRATRVEAVIEPVIAEFMSLMAPAIRGDRVAIREASQL